MTLKQKFEEILTAFWINDWEGECEKIADEFAIRFANWYDFMLKQNDNLNERFTAREILEMFKKENLL